jgi:hypothetical protein
VCLHECEGVPVRVGRGVGRVVVVPELVGRSVHMCRVPAVDTLRDTSQCTATPLCTVCPPL